MDIETKKAKAVEAQKRYRTRIRQDIIKTTTHEDYKKIKAGYMKEYRKKIKENKPVKEPVITPVIAEILQEIVPEIIITPMEKQIIIKNIIPKWSKNITLECSDKDIIKLRSYDIDKKEAMINKIVLVMSKVLLLEASKDNKRILRIILSGYDIKNDIKYFNKYMPFLSENNIIKFINDVHKIYTKETTLYSMLSPFANILSRLPTYNNSYQQIAITCKNCMNNYNEIRDDNKVEPVDEGKIFNFNPDDVKNHIDTKLKTDLDKAIAACYSLQPPRRLEFQFMLITNITDTSILINENYNYLIMKEDIPYCFVYNKYKTYTTYKQQIILVNDDVKPYLCKYINNLKNPIDNYLFGSNDNMQQNKKFGTKLSKIFYNMYNKNITSTWIRASAVTYLNNYGDKKTLKERKIYANDMAHDIKTALQYEKVLKDL